MPLGGEQRIELDRGARADPGGAVEAGVTEIAERRPQPLAPGSLGDPLDDDDMPAAVPWRRVAPVDPVGGLRSRLTARGVSRYPAPSGSLTGSSQPCLAILETAVRTAGAEIPSGASSRTSAATGACSPRESR